MPQIRMTALLLLGLMVVAAPMAADHIPVLNEDAKLLASDGAAGDYFGEQVAIEGDTIVVGARKDDDGGQSTGSVLVYERDASGVWVETAKLSASDGLEFDAFGSSVSVSGETLVVGALGTGNFGENSGAVYVFERKTSGGWVQMARLVASDGGTEDRFGESVALYGDTFVVGAEFQDDRGANSGAAYVFERDESGMWMETAKLLASDGAEAQAFGCHVAIDGDTIGVSARGDSELALFAGAAYIFEKNNVGVWVETAKLLTSDGQEGDIFGTPIEIDGDILAVGADGDDDKGFQSGAAYVFERDESGTWVEKAKLYSPHPAVIDSFHYVAVSGQTVVVGASSGDGQPGDSTGTVDYFRRNQSGEWVNVTRFLPSDGLWGDQFGIDVAIDGETVVVGARLQDELGEDAGAAYIFSLESFVLEIRLDPQGVSPGDELQISLYLEYNRTETVTVPFRLWIEDAAGIEVASRTTPPMTLRPGDALTQGLTVQIPPGTPSGRYFVKVGAERFGEWTPVAAEAFEVLGSSNALLQP